MAELVKQALGKKMQNVLYMAPTRQQAKDILWTELKRISKGYLSDTPLETELKLTYVTGSTIRLMGAEAYDRARGIGYDLVCLDEFADIAPEAWVEVLRPALADRQGRAVFAGTPKGYNHFYDLYLRAKELTDWSAFSFTTLDGGRVPQSEVEAARASMSAGQFRQEYEASFESMEGRVYLEFDRDANVRSDIADNGSDLYVGMDFNVNPMTAVVMVRAGDQLHQFAEFELKNSNTAEMAGQIRANYPNRNITIYPDPTGRQRQTSAVGQTDFTILKEHGFNVYAPKAAPPVVDRINEVNAVLRAADGTRRYYLHPRCTSTIKALDGLVYQKGTNHPDKLSGLIHITDAVGYAVHALEPMVKRHIATSRKLKWA
jgi:hypothetical protein